MIAIFYTHDKKMFCLDIYDYEETISLPILGEWHYSDNNELQFKTFRLHNVDHLKFYIDDDMTEDTKFELMVSQKTNLILNVKTKGDQ